MELKFKVNKQHISRTDAEKVVADSRNYLSCAFSFSEDWNGTVKTAVFKKGSTVYHTVISDDKIAASAMPQLGAGKWEVSVFGGNRITADVAVLNVFRSGYDAENAPSPPAQSVYDSLVALCGEAKATADAVAADAAAGKFNGTGTAGKDGKDGIDGKDGKSAYESAVEKGFEGDEAAWLASLKGADGKDGVAGSAGSAGADGYSPTVSLSRGENFVTVSITDKNGTKTATILDGADANVTVDALITSDSANPVRSSAIYAELAEKQSKAKFYSNVSASSWTADSTYSDYGYKCELSLSGVGASDFAFVTFGVTEADSGNYAPVAETAEGKVIIYSKVNTAVTIKSVAVFPAA